MGAVAALAIGLGAGYWYGHNVGRARGVDQGRVEEKARQDTLAIEARRQAEKEAAKAVNVFEQANLNPFSKSQTNPYEKVKINPF